MTTTGSDPRWVRSEAIVHRTVGSDAFLVHPGSDALFHLNPLGGALWRLLAEPIRLDEACGVVVAAFPDTPAERVREDTARLFRELADCGLIRTAEG